MKELSLEEKAKAYDEALERAKIWQEHLYEVDDKDYADELNYIFPELAESEDERIKKEIIEIVMQPTWKTEKEFHRRKELCDWIEKQGQKSAWSEEDEGFLNLLLAIFTNEHPNGVFSTDGITVFKGNCVTSNRIITWLKSLRPQNRWKPSDEQIEALERMVNFAHFEEVGNRNIVRELLGQLKKLKG